MKKILYNLYNVTIGQLLRLAQSTIRVQTNSQKLFDFIDSKVLEDCADYALKNFSGAIRFSTRQEIWNFCLNKFPKASCESNSIILEFGVWKGTSINFFAKNSPESILYGFDSFEGLEEDWTGRNLLKGAFNRYGVMPRVESNVTLVKGWFEDTVPKFIDLLGTKKIRLIHMDADTYKPTYFVLNSLVKSFKAGTIIIFDEYIGYNGWRNHEYKAWQEVVTIHNLNYRYIGYGFEQVAIEII